MKKIGKIFAGALVATLAIGAGATMVACDKEVKVYVSNAEELVAAVEETKGGERIVLSESFEINTMLQIDKTLTIDLNGKTLSAGDEINGITMFKVGNGGKLTIGGKGVVDAATDANDYSMAVWALNGGEVVINGGTFTNYGAKDFEDDGVTPNNNELIYANYGGIIKINGGTFIGNYENERWGTRYTLNMLDEKPSTEAIEAGTITVKGGKFYGYNPKESLSENPQADFVAEGYDVSLDGNYYVVYKK